MTLDLAPVQKGAGVCAYGRCPIRIRQGRYCRRCRPLVKAAAYHAQKAQTVATRAPRQRNDPRDLGPELPLDGLTGEEHMRRRYARILAAARDGVPGHALAERFGEGARHVVQAAGIRTADPGLPYGEPAP